MPSAATKGLGDLVRAFEWRSEDATTSVAVAFEWSGPCAQQHWCGACGGLRQLQLEHSLGAAPSDWSSWGGREPSSLLGGGISGKGRLRSVSMRVAEVTWQAWGKGGQRASGSGRRQTVSALDSGPMMKQLDATLLWCSGACVWGVLSAPAWRTAPASPAQALVLTPAPAVQSPDAAGIKQSRSAAQASWRSPSRRRQQGTRKLVGPGAILAERMMGLA